MDPRSPAPYRTTVLTPVAGEKITLPAFGTQLTLIAMYPLVGIMTGVHALPQLIPFEYLFTPVDALTETPYAHKFAAEPPTPK